MKTSNKGYLLCPGCGQPTKVKVLPKTRLQEFPLWCPWCKREAIVNK